MSGWTEKDLVERQIAMLDRPMARTGRIKGVSAPAARTYNGRVYHSKSEAEYAQRLDFQVKAGIVTQYLCQAVLPITVNAVLICKVVVDFKVFMADGTEEYVEVKGFETETFRLKKKLLLACYPGIRYTVLKVGADL